VSFGAFFKKLWQLLFSYNDTASSYNGKEVVISYRINHVILNRQKTFKIYEFTMKIPGLSFSWERALGISKLKRDFVKATGIPTTRNGLERKIGGAIINAIYGKLK